MVLVFHGIDDIVWEPTPYEKLQEYFFYIKSTTKTIFGKHLLVMWQDM
jgi:hypothetical protein